jgi:hypothetical protein
MSYTIHYFGRLQKPELLSELQEEFAEFAQVSGWSHEIVDHVFPRENGQEGVLETLKGIRIKVSPDEDPVRFTFDQDGYLAHMYYESEGTWPMAMAREAARTLRSESTDTVRVLHREHAHTTIRGKEPYAHVTLVNLLDHLEKKYVPNLEVIDKSGYWTSRDAKALEFRPLVGAAL